MAALLALSGCLHAALAGDGSYISWAAQPVRPAEVAMLQCSGHGGANASVTVRLRALTPTATLHTIVPASVSAATVSFRVPAELEYSQYVVQLQTAGGALSNNFMLNAPKAWWWQGDAGNTSTVGAGGWLRAFGDSLQLGDAPSSATLCTSTDRKCVTIPADEATSSAYSLTFKLEGAALEGSAGGRYTLALANSPAPPTPQSFFEYNPFLGSASPFVKHKDFIDLIVPPASPPPVHVFSVIDYGGTGKSILPSDDQTNAVRGALAAAAKVCTSSTTARCEVLFPRGRYFTNASLAIPRETPRPLPISHQMAGFKKSSFLRGNFQRLLVFAARTTMRGEARHLASVYFFEYSNGANESVARGHPKAPEYYITMGGNAAIADLTLYVTGYFGSGASCNINANFYIENAEIVRHSPSKTMIFC